MPAAGTPLVSEFRVYRADQAGVALWPGPSRAIGVGPGQPGQLNPYREMRTMPRATFVELSNRICHRLRNPGNPAEQPVPMPARHGTLAAVVYFCPNGHAYNDPVQTNVLSANPPADAPPGGPAPYGPLFIDFLTDQNMRTLHPLVIKLAENLTHANVPGMALFRANGTYAGMYDDLRIGLGNGDRLLSARGMSKLNAGLQALTSGGGAGQVTAGHAKGFLGELVVDHLTDPVELTTTPDLIVRTNVQGQIGYEVLQVKLTIPKKGNQPCLHVHRLDSWIARCQAAPLPQQVACDLLIVIPGFAFA